MDKKKILLRALPKVDDCLARLQPNLEPHIPQLIVKQCVQAVIEREREIILQGEAGGQPLTDNEWEALFVSAIGKKVAFNFRRVFNCTGVVVHTNLGRSLLPSETSNQLQAAACHYSNLEFNLDTGKRGSRYSLVEEILCELTGAEAALVVNNNAAAVLLALDTLASGREVIVSRGQLVEIGGSFRIPDVMAKSGARLVEVGATNRTHYKDYEQAISCDTAMLLRVHTSNFRVIGFTSEVSPEEMVRLAKMHGLMTMEDLGSGSLIDLSQYGLVREPTVQDVVKAGIDVITFSGDKLLGGPQAGIIVGRREVVERIKRNPLNRALRIDKFTLSALESLLRYYYDIPSALENVPTLRMLTEDEGSVKKRAMALFRRIHSRLDGFCAVKVVPTVSRVGGGAMPECDLPSWAVALEPGSMRMNQLESSFRQLNVPIIGRVENDIYLLDARTIQPGEIAELSSTIVAFFKDRG